MKKLSILLFLLTAFVFAKAQYPIQQSVANAPNTIGRTNAFRANDGFVNGVFTDTTAANLKQIKAYPGAQIFTTLDSSFWLRNPPATRWLKANAGAGSISSFNFITDSSLIVCYGDGTCDTIPIFNLDSTIINVVNNNFTSINILPDSTGAIICTGTGAAIVCDTLLFDLDSIVNIYFLNDSTLVGCQEPQVIQVGDVITTQQLCDTINVQFRGTIYQNGVQQFTPRVVEHGWPQDFENPSQLNHDTYLYSLYFQYKIAGVPYLREVFGVQQKRVTWEGNTIQSWNHGGVNSDNDVNLYAGYTDAFVGDTTGFVKDRVGYLLSTNSVGSRYSMGVNNTDSKQSGLLFHTKDTSNTDGVTIFATQDPLTMPFYNTPGTTTWYDKRIAVFKTDLSTNFLGKVYLTNGRLEPDTAQIAAANNLTLGLGNVNLVSGATQINAITTSGWQAGSSPVYLVFAGAPLVKNNTAGGAGTATILLAGLTDFQAAAGDVLALLYDGTNWRETNRALASGAPVTNIIAMNGLWEDPSNTISLGSNTPGDAVFSNDRYIYVGAHDFQIYTDDNGVPLILNNLTSGDALSSFSTGGVAGRFQSGNSTTNTILDVVTVNRSSNSTPAAGMGGAIGFQLETSDLVNNVISNRLISKWVDPLNATRTSQLDITGVNSASTTTIMSAYGSGVVGIGISSGYTATRLQVVDNSVAAIMVDLSSTSTQATAGTVQKLLNVTLSGANANSSATTWAGFFTNTHTGTGAVNEGVRGTASGGQNNYGIVGQSSGTGTTVGVYGESGGSAGISIWGFSNVGSAARGVRAEGQTGSIPLEARSVTTTTNVAQIVQYISTVGPANTVAAGFGSTLEFLLSSASAGPSSRTSNQIISTWAVATDASRESQLDFTGVTNAATQTWLTLGESGYMKLRGMNVTEAGAITAADGMIVYVTNTDATFTSVGFWGRENSVWVKL